MTSKATGRSSSSSWKPSPATTLLPYTFLCTIGPSVTAATSLLIVRYTMCKTYYNTREPDYHPSPYDEKCNIPDIEAITSTTMALLAFLDGGISLLSTSYIQRLSDRAGRKPCLVGLPFVAMVSTASMMLAYGTQNVPLAWALLVCNGIFVAANTKSVFVPTLCVADASSEDERTTFYSRLEAVALVGPGCAYVVSALASRYSRILLLPYYLSLLSQLLAGLYALFFIPETNTSPTPSSSGPSSPGGDGEEDQTAIEVVAENLVAPVKPLSVLWPRKGEDGKRGWRLTALSLSLLATTSGTVFIATALLFFLSDKFDFDPESNGWLLAYVTASRGFYLLLIFPLVLKWGRIGWARLEKRRESKRSGETQRLLSEDGVEGSKENEEEANHFDVILAFLSVLMDSLALFLIFLSKSWQQVIGSLAVLAIATGDAPTYKSAFVASVPAEQASQALAALDMILSIAKLASPPLLGSLYAVFVKVGRPEMLFLASSGFCLLGAVLLGPVLYRTSRR